MSAPAVIGFAGVLVAAVATGLLAGRAVREPAIGRMLLVAAGLALTVALAAESIGFDRGFGSATFRAVQLSGLLLAPLWLAWGLAELSWPAEAARFGVGLACAALTVVGVVILASDPLVPVPFGQQWPQAGLHYQPPSLYALNAVQAVAVILAVASAVLIVVPGRRGWPRPGTAPQTAAVAVAVLLLAAMRFSLPGRSVYPLLGLAAAALAWLGASRLTGGPARAVSGPQWPAADEPMSPRAGGHEDDRPGPYQANGQGVLAGGRWAQASRDWPEPGGDRPRADGSWPGAASAVSDPPGPPPGPAGRPYGRILVFTLLEDRLAEFDRLAEHLAEEVLAEPDTLVFVIHLVPNAPMQRIFYEVYRDRAAFDRHEREPYVTRFAAARRPCVLATNVIELRLKYAKVAPLPAAPQSAPEPPASPPQVPQAQVPHAEVPQAPAPQAQVLEPLPPRPGQGPGYAQYRHGGR